MPVKIKNALYLFFYLAESQDSLSVSSVFGVQHLLKVLKAHQESTCVTSERAPHKAGTPASPLSACLLLPPVTRLDAFDVEDI